MTRVSVSEIWQEMLKPATLVMPFLRDGELAADPVVTATLLLVFGLVWAPWWSITRMACDVFRRGVRRDVSEQHGLSAQMPEHAREFHGRRSDATATDHVIVYHRQTAKATPAETR